MAGSFKWQPSFAAGVLGPGLHGRVDIAKYQVGLKTGRNIFIHPHGGFSNRSGTRFISFAKAHGEIQRLIPFERDENTSYALIFNGSSMRVARNGELVLFGGLAYEIPSPYPAASVPTINYVQSVDVMYLASTIHAPRKLTHTGPTSWAFSHLVTAPTTPTPGAPTVVSAATGDGKVYQYRVAAVIDGVEGMPSPVGQVTDAQDIRKEGAQNTITWTALASPPDEYRVYRLRGGIWGYIGFTNGTTTTLLDDNIDPDTNSTVRKPVTLFSGAGNFPGVVTLTQQRLIWGGSLNNPETIWGSVVGDYENYTRAEITKADDRFEIDISGEKLNRVTGLVGMQELVALTGSGEYGIGAANGVLSATEPRQVRYGSSGSSGVRPLLVGDSILYVDRSGRLVRDLRYSFESDGYAGNDLSVFINHFLNGFTLQDWAYCHSPYGIVWVVRSDGAVLSLTYKREQEVWAWCEHDFGGKVESVCSLHEGGYDALYLSVIRTLGGFQRRCVERLCNRIVIDSPMDGCFLDCAVSYNGPATNTITGLGHLDGERINVIADWDVFEGLLVEDGKVTLPVQFTQAHAGLPYVSEAETLPLYIELQGTGASRGLPVKATQVFAQLEKTRGIEIFTTEGDQGTEMIQTEFDLADRIPLFTGLWSFDLYADYNPQGTIRVVQRYPLPMTVLGLSPNWVIGR